MSIEGEFGQTAVLAVANSSVLRHAEIAKLLDVLPRTVLQYRIESKAGGRYANHPFPEPDGYQGRSPCWAIGRTIEIREWDRTRVGRGKGGGWWAQKRNQATGGER